MLLVMAAMIVIVDDEPDMVETCRRTLEQLGHTCVGALDGIKALELIEAMVPDVVLADLNLPGRDGIEIAREVSRRFPWIPVVMMTAYHTPSVATTAFHAGVSQYLIKPFTNAELRTAIERALGTVN